MKFALDSNVILYFEGLNDELRQHRAQTLVSVIGKPNIVVPIQALLETFNRLSRAIGWTKVSAAAQTDIWFRHFKTQVTSNEVFEHAQELVVGHGFQVFDAVILAASNVAGASVLFSEDMQHGFFWRGVTIINPFSNDSDIFLRSLRYSKPH